MTIFFRQICYAYTPKDQPPIFKAIVEVDGRRRTFHVRCRNCLEARQEVCRQLGVPYSEDQFTATAKSLPAVG